MTRNRIAGLAIASMLIPTAVQAQQREYYGADGRVTGREVIGSGGSTVIFDSSGRVAGRTATDSQGTTTIYGADGRRIGTERQDKRR